MIEKAIDLLLIPYKNNLNLDFWFLIKIDENTKLNKNKEYKIIRKPETDTNMM